MWNRRAFLRHSSAGSATGMVLAASSSWGWSQSTPSAPLVIAGKSADLRVHTADPAVIETPVARLGADLVTPVPELFVRNNANPEGMSTTAPPATTDWPIELVGLNGGRQTIDRQTLQSLPRQSVEMVLQCSGNGRALFSRAAKVPGTPWGLGGIGNVRFEGVRLADVLRHLGVEPKSAARYVAAEGVDTPRAGEDFEHSVPLDDALETSILALSLNGGPLPAVHGGPVRFVMPGYYGTVQLKWLTRLRFEPEESGNEHHAVRYRTPNRLLRPGESFEFNRENSSPTWRMKVASLITSHADGQSVPAGPLALAGYAWNDGRVPLTQVLISTDQGGAWRRAKLQQATSLYAWSRWSADLDAPAGELPVWVQAIDALGRSQPIDGEIFWNPGGYEWNAVSRLTLKVG